MIEIKLTEDASVLVDDADLLLVSGFEWRLWCTNPDLTSYSHAWNRNQSVFMHRLVAGAGETERVDHADGNGLNNTRFNLRIATSTQNQANRRLTCKTSRTSRFKGVHWDTGRSKWMASIHVDGKTKYLGRYAGEAEAAFAYDSAAESAWGEFARLNFPVVNQVVQASDLT